MENSKYFFLIFEPFPKCEDGRELVDKFSDVEAVTAATIYEASAVFGELGDLLTSVEGLLEHEMSMNWSVFVRLSFISLFLIFSIASREKLGWLVVKMLEKDPLFDDDDDGSKTKEVRQAAYRAGQIAKVIILFKTSVLILFLVVF